MNLSTAPSTRLILGEKTPGQFFPALADNHQRSRILKAVKDKKFPYGFNLEGIQ